MIYEYHHVWVKRHREPHPIQVRMLRTGDVIACKDEDGVVFCEVKSIIPVFSGYTELQFLTHKSVYLADSSTILTPTGYCIPEKEQLVICNTTQPKVRVVKNVLTAKRFYSIMLSSNLPIVIEEGFCVKS